MTPLVLLAAACSLVAGDADVVELTTHNWDQTSEGLWLVEFYAPWCAHCKRLEPIYERVASYFHNNGEKAARIGRVDGTAQAGLMTPFDVKGYPTMIMLRDGKRVTDFKGKRTYDDILQFVERHVSGEADRDEPESASPSPPRKRRGRSALLSRAKAYATSLLTDHDPLTAGLVMLGGAMTCGGAMLIALVCLSSPRPPGR